MAQADVDQILGQCKPMSELGKEVADLIGDLVSGIYHYGEWLTTDWSHERCITLRWNKTMSTFDDSLLSRLVFLAHDRAIRVELSPKSQKNVELMFHRRSHDATEFYARHPTLGQAVMRHRELHPMRPTEIIIELRKGTGGRTEIERMVEDYVVNFMGDDDDGSMPHAKNIVELVLGAQRVVKEYDGEYDQLCRDCETPADGKCTDGVWRCYACAKESDYKIV
jgi:hypothetical protein